MSINLRQEKFCQAYATYGNASKAYREAYQGALGAGSSGFRMLQNAEIKARIEEITGEACEKSEIDRDYLIQFWREVADTPIGEIDESHPLAQEYQLNESGMKIKMPSKEQAAKELARLIGAYETPKLKISADDDLVGLLAGIAGVREDED